MTPEERVDAILKMPLLLGLLRQHMTDAIRVAVAEEREACLKAIRFEGPCCANQKCHEACEAAILARTNQ